MRSQHLIGQTFGRLTIVSVFVENKTEFCLCRCSCGNEKAARVCNVRYGGTKSCGCLHVETVTARNYKHGGSCTREFRVWQTIKRRCTSPSCKEYPHYGGRGITIDPSWERFAKFLEDMGPRPSPKHSIERVDNNGPYSKENCRWATDLEQANNKRNNRFLTYKGETLGLHAWAKKTGIPRTTLQRRMDVYKWPPEKVIEAPIGEGQHRTIKLER